ncbi:MAG: filamentous hemagglutinin N-terminal domain-containing protein [Novosphingobium sp.]|nr:filamentous hemagglutinin N-terminal domain-containing protein [Novosphingobium sp.]
MRPHHSLKRLAVLALLSATALSGAAHAQTVQTTIIADTRGSTGQNTVIDGNQGTIFIGGGTVVAANQFYSFEQFDLAAGDTAFWQAPGSGTISNIVNRVTGNLSSHINGTIDTTALPGADFWFINPNGVLFGQGANLNVPGAAYFSTGSEVRFANGDVFSARTPEGSTLSISNPVAFGFVGGEAGLTISGVGEPLFSGSSLPEAVGWTGATFVAPDLTVELSGIQTSVLDLIASGTAGEVPLFGDLPATIDGTLTISQSDFLLRAALAPASGDFLPLSRFVAGIVAIDLTNIASLTEIDAPASGIAIGSTSQLGITDSTIASLTNGAGAGGTITLGSNDSLSIAGIAIISSSLLETGGGDAGAIRLSAFGPISITGSTFSATTAGTAAGGLININSIGSVSVDDTELASATSLQSNNGGLGADIQLVSGTGLNVSNSALVARTDGTGTGGNVYLEAGSELSIADSDLFSTANSIGNGGNVIVNSLGALDVSTSQFSAATNATGTSGDSGIAALISAGDLSFVSSTLSTDTFGSGDGGIARILSGGGLIIADSVITADTVGGSGNGGFINISAEQSISATNTEIYADTYGQGRGGDITLGAGADISLTGGYISSESLAVVESPFFGDAGTVLLSAPGNLSIDGSTVSSDSFGSGGGGGLFFEIGQKATLTGGTSVFANTSGSGPGGVISFVADELVVTDSEIAAATNSSGDSAGLLIGARKVTVGSGGAITSASTDSGNAGLVFIGGDVDEPATPSEEINVVDGGAVSASATGTGAAGNVVLNADRINVLRGGNITAESANALPAGFISLTAGEVLVDGVGAGGAPSQVFSVNTLADPAPGGTNLGGDILVETGRLTVSNGGVLNTSSVSADAGAIVIDLGQSDTGIVFLRGDPLPGSIVTDSGQQGSGGIINILNAYAVIADNSEISASGDVSNAVVIIDESTIRINSSDATNVVNVAGYSAVAPEQDVSSGTTVAEVSFLDAAEVLANRCQAARARGKSNTLQIDQIGPYSLAPKPELAPDSPDLASGDTGRTCS